MSPWIDAMMNRFPRAMALLAALGVYSLQAVAAPGEVEANFPLSNTIDIVRSIALQPDGAILVSSTNNGGVFQMGDVIRFGLTRLLPDGSVDPTFTPVIEGGTITSLGVQGNGKILISGPSKVNGVAVPPLARLNADGSLDDFSITLNGSVTSLLVQADEKILIAGNFSNVNGTAVPHVARLEANGALDTSFTARPGGFGFFTPVLADLTETGEVLIVDQQTLHVLAPDGMESHARGFTAVPIDPRLRGATEQLDKRILVCGTDLRGTYSDPGGCVVRLLSDGSLDPAFSPPSLYSVDRLALQTDGNALAFNFGATRLKPDGSTDTSFHRAVLTSDGGGLGPGGYVDAIAIQADGRILLGSSIVAADGVAHHNLVRLENDPATQSLIVADSTRVQWLRGGTSPETHQVIFESSTDAGATWASLGAGVRISGGWELTGLNLPSGAQVRARARIGGNLLESYAPSLTTTLAPAIVAPRPGTAIGQQSRIAFSLPEDAQPGSVTVTFDDGTTQHVLTLAASEATTGPHAFTFDASNPAACPKVASASGGALTEGLYTVTLTYRDADGNAPASTVAAGVIVDLTPPSLGGTYSPLTIATRAGQFILGIGTADLPDYTGQAVITDEVGVARVVQSPLPHTNVPAGTTTVTLTAWDTAGNAADLTFDVQVNDATPPSIQLPFGDGNVQSIEAGSDDTAKLPDYRLQATVTDNVGVVSFEQSPAPGSSQSGFANVTLTAKDAADNTTVKTVHVSVTDNSAPTITSTSSDFSPLVLHVAQGAMAPLPDYATQTATDDPNATIFQDPPAGVMVGDGVVQVSITAKDPVGNVSDPLTFNVPVLVSGTSALASKGATVPNPNSDPRIPSGATWATFGIPSITMAGADAGWLGTFRAGGKSLTGIFCGPIGEPLLRLMVGDPITDSSGTIVDGVTFKSLREPVFACDEYAVVATVKGVHVTASNDTGIWCDVGGQLRQIAREGELAPGTSAKFKAFTSICMPAPGQVFFVAKLAAPAASDLGFWRWTENDGTKLCLREGDVPAGYSKPLKSFVALSDVKGSPGHARHFVSPVGGGTVGAIDVLLTFTDGTPELIDVRADGGIDSLNSAGITDSNGNTVVGYGIPSGSAAGFIGTSLARIQHDAARGITAGNDLEVLDGASERVVAQTGTIAPGAAPAQFKTFLDPVAGRDAAENQVIAFIGTMSGATVGNDTGIWGYGSQSGAATLLAREGYPALDSNGSPALGAKWKRFVSLSVLDGRGPMFVATLASAGQKVNTGNDTGLWATDSRGALRLIVRKGDEIAPNKKLKVFNLLGSVAGSPGQRRAWVSGDLSGRVIYRATFTDGSSAIVSTAVP